MPVSYKDFWYHTNSPGPVLQVKCLKIFQYALDKFQHVECTAGFMWGCCTYQEILLVSRLDLHGFSLLGNTSKAPASCAAYEGEFCHWKFFKDDTWSCGPIYKYKITCHCKTKMAYNTELTTQLFLSKSWTTISIHFNSIHVCGRFYSYIK